MNMLFNVAVVVALWGRNQKLLLKETLVEGVPHFQLFTKGIELSEDGIRRKDVMARVISEFESSLQVKTVKSAEMIYDLNNVKTNVNWDGRHLCGVIAIDLSLADGQEVPPNLVEVDPMDVFTSAIYLHSKEGHRTPTGIYINNYMNSCCSDKVKLEPQDLGVYSS